MQIFCCKKENAKTETNSQKNIYDKCSDVRTNRGTYRWVIWSIAKTICTNVQKGKAIILFVACLFVYLLWLKDTVEIHTDSYKYSYFCKILTPK